MKRYEVTSGEFCLVLNEVSHVKAANKAIILHQMSNHSSSLGEITMTESDDSDDNVMFFSTQRIIDNVCIT